MLQMDPVIVGGGGWVLSWDAGSARAAGFAKGTGRQVPPALPGLSHPWVTPTGRHLHDADEVPAANVQWEGGKSRVGARLWRGGRRLTIMPQGGSGSWLPRLNSRPPPWLPA